MSRPPPAPSLNALPCDVRHRIEQFASLVKQLSDAAGAEPWTGYAVAGEIAQGLACEWAAAKERTA